MTSARSKSTAMCVAEMARISASHDLGGFQKLYGDGFFLQKEMTQDDRPTWAKFGTVATTKEIIAKVDSTIAAEHQIIAIPTSGRPPFPRWITIGRIARNVIVIEHPSVSKLHAMIHYAKGRYLVSDAGSKNGTEVNDRPIVRYDRGPPYMLKTGDRVKVGTVSLSFFAAPQLWQLLRDWQG